ncbi:MULTISPECIES: JAB domain-containing protein [Achromobacter]|uniref:JAB domain-containing protein n=1 Tax=Achromobacter TaxID=222 RepID=UPI00338F7669
MPVCLLLWRTASHHWLGLLSLVSGGINRRLTLSPASIAAARPPARPAWIAGSLKSSRADIEVTRRLKEAMAPVNVSLIDHVIRAAGSGHSMVKMGLM